jgi:hypothetical protein
LSLNVGCAKTELSRAKDGKEAGTAVSKLKMDMFILFLNNDTNKQLRKLNHF